VVTTPNTNAGSQTIVVGTGSLSAEGGDVVVGVGKVVEGRNLRETQSAPASDIVYRSTPHYMLGQADFNRLVDPPPRTHAFFPGLLGLWIGSLINASAPLLLALFDGTPLSIWAVPPTARYAFVVVSILLVGLYLKVHLSPNPRDKLIERIAKTYERDTESGGE
jgi:hypothetical protein